MAKKTEEGLSRHELHQLMLIICAISTHFYAEVFPHYRKKINKWLIPLLSVSLAWTVLYIMSVLLNWNIASMFRMFSTLSIGAVWFCAGYSTAQDKYERIFLDEMDSVLGETMKEVNKLAKKEVKKNAKH